MQLTINFRLFRVEVQSFVNLSIAIGKYIAYRKIARRNSKRKIRSTASWNTELRKQIFKNEKASFRKASMKHHEKDFIKNGEYGPVSLISL